MWLFLFLLLRLYDLATGRPCEKAAVVATYRYPELFDTAKKILSPAQSGPNTPRFLTIFFDSPDLETTTLQLAYGQQDQSPSPKLSINQHTDDPCVIVDKLMNGDFTCSSQDPSCSKSHDTAESVLNPMPLDLVLFRKSGDYQCSELGNMTFRYIPNDASLEKYKEEAEAFCIGCDSKEFPLDISVAARKLGASQTVKDGSLAGRAEGNETHYAICRNSNWREVARPINICTKAVVVLTSNFTLNSTLEIIANRTSEGNGALQFALFCFHDEQDDDLYLYRGEGGEVTPVSFPNFRTSVADICGAIKAILVQGLGRGCWNEDPKLTERCLTYLGPILPEPLDIVTVGVECNTKQLGIQPTNLNLEDLDDYMQKRNDFCDGCPSPPSQGYAEGSMKLGKHPGRQVTGTSLDVDCTKTENKNEVYCKDAREVSILCKTGTWQITAASGDSDGTTDGSSTTGSGTVYPVTHHDVGLSKKLVTTPKTKKKSGNLIASVVAPIMALVAVSIIAVVGVLLYRRRYVKSSRSVPKRKKGKTSKEDTKEPKLPSAESTDAAKVSERANVTSMSDPITLDSQVTKTSQREDTSARKSNKSPPVTGGTREVLPR